MFIGEVGCWLVVGIQYLVRRYVSSGDDSLSDADAGAERPLLARDEEDEDRTLADTDYHDDDNGSVKTGTEKMQLNGWKVLLMALPAVCDIIGTTLMNVGLLFVAASIYQMTRGALVLFVGLFSVVFLKRYLGLYKWFSLFVVVAGVAVVGLAGAIAKEHKVAPGSHENSIRIFGVGEVGKSDLSPAVWTIIGVIIIACAQIFTATQFVLEERIMEKYYLEPLHAVGWEGLWGLLVTILIMIVGHVTYGKGYFDMREGLGQMFGHRSIAVSSVLIMISIGYVLVNLSLDRLCPQQSPPRIIQDSQMLTTNLPLSSGFNFFGLSVTNTLSATSRSTIDTCRTLFIWLVSLGLGWESFKWLQVLGFALLVYGTFLFNDLIKPPPGCGGRDQRAEVLLPEAPIEHQDNRPNA